MKKTAVEWLGFELNMLLMDVTEEQWYKAEKLFEQAKEMEKTDIDNKVIHFAEWLTKKHTLVLTTLYEQFEEEFYK